MIAAALVLPILPSIGALMLLALPNGGPFGPVLAWLVGGAD